MLLTSVTRIKGAGSAFPESTVRFSLESMRMLDETTRIETQTNYAVFVRINKINIFHFRLQFKIYVQASCPVVADLYA